MRINIIRAKIYLKRMCSYGRKKNEIILFENQEVKLEVNLREETVWLTQAQMGILFDVKQSTLDRKSVV